MEHLENRTRKAEVGLVHALVQGILRDHPPFKKDEPTEIEEIDRWFDTDPKAPLIVCSMPPGGLAHSDPPRIEISINQHAVERELRARGVGEEHPSWDVARRAVGPILCDMTKEAMAEAAKMMVHGEIPINGLSAE